MDAAAGAYLLHRVTPGKIEEGSSKMGTTKLLYQVSTALVVLLFGFAGLVKLVPGLSPEIHQEMVSDVV
jgi:hypothetical protein